MAALLVAGAAFNACSDKDSLSDVEEPAEKVYTLIINASKSNDTNTRALVLDGSALRSRWAESDVLTVIKGTTPVGTATVKAGTISADGQTATFVATVAGIAVDDELTLAYHPHASLNDFGSQNGTLASASDYDVATATVTVKSIDGTSVTIKEATPTFVTETAMIKLTLQDSESAPINATSLKLSATISGTYNSIPYSIPVDNIYKFSTPASTYTTNGNGILYFSLASLDTAAEALVPILNAKFASIPLPITVTKDQVKVLLASATITFSASDGTNTYTVTKPGYQFAAAKYYAATLSMTKVVE